MMPLKLISLLGWFTMIAVAWAISYNRKLFPWRTVVADENLLTDKFIQIGGIGSLAP